MKQSSTTMTTRAEGKVSRAMEVSSTTLHYLKRLQGSSHAGLDLGVYDLFASRFPWLR